MDITHVTLSLAKSTKTSKISTFIQNNHIWLAFCMITSTYIKLYVILNEFLIKLSSQKITECVALQWSQNQLDHRFTKKITVELSVVSLWLIWWGGWGCTVRSFTAIGVGPLVNGFTNLILHRLCGLRELFDDTLKEQQTTFER